MPKNIDRRVWLQQTSLLLAGLGLAPALVARNGQRAQGSSPQKAIILNSNENPYGPSPMARDAMTRFQSGSNRYPDDLLFPLKQKIAKHWAVGEENILLGAGSSEIIGLAALYAGRRKGHILAAEPGYKVWEGQANAFGLEVKNAVLPRHGHVAVNTLFRPVTPETRMVYLCNPNNPTGAAFPVADVRDFVLETSGKTLVFLDEAYTEFANLDSLATLAAGHKNIIIAKTFSKIYGLAGARIGYAIAGADLVTALSRYQPWPEANVSTVSVAAASASLDDTAFVTACREKTAAAKESCYAVFKELGLEYFPSAANFILFNIERKKAKVEEAMKQQQILLQYRQHYGEHWCRVTMGTEEEMALFIRTLQSVYA